MTRLIDLLMMATHDLGAVSDSARLDAELLLAHVLRCERNSLQLRAESQVEAPEASAFHDLTAARAGGVPVAYLIGIKEFWSMPLRVTPAVLVPRPETEVLVELALTLLNPRKSSRILDLGTGSGAIALALAQERPDAEITATDLSAAALEVARSNAKSLRLERIHWREGHWFDAVPHQQFDLVVSNPPYVASADPHLQALTAEPRSALTAGPSGLEAYQAIIPAAGPHLKPGGWIVFEHGAGQAADVANLLEESGFVNVRSHPDYSGAPRVTLGSFHSNAQRLP